MEGLGGTIELLEASCRKCESTTSAFEAKVIQSIFDIPRRALGVRTRAKTANPRLPFKVVVGGADVELRVPFDVHPKLLLMPHYGAPNIVSGLPPERCNLSGVWFHYFKDSGLTPTDLKAQGHEGAYSPPLDTVSFAQFLAKIAHAFAVSQVGFRAFKPFLCEALRTDFGKKGVWAERYHFVGGRPDNYPASSALHELGILLTKPIDKWLVVVRIRLFACLGAPIYLVAVGALPGEPPKDWVLSENS
jgi:hypothetical protein